MHDMDVFLERLRCTLVTPSRILMPDDPDYEPALIRWDNVATYRPAAVVQPASEQEIALTIQEALKNGVPFVPVCGGHSPWSIADENGIVLDLRLCKRISVDPERRLVMVQGGVLMKDFQVALREKQQWTAVANGNTVGVIPYMIGGGISSYSPLVGYACENIVAARMIAANGEIVTASEEQNRDLLWAIRGAGQFLGLVLELTVRTYDLAAIGPDGVRQIGNIFFPVERAAEVCQTLAEIVDKNDHQSSGHFMVMKNPKGDGTRVLMVAPQYFGSRSGFEATFRPLIDLKPLSYDYMDCSFENHSDHLGFMLEQAGHKHFSQTGLQKINPSAFVLLVKLHGELLTTYPGTDRSVFTIEWHTPTPLCEARNTPTAFGHKNIDIWLNILTWYSDAKYRQAVSKYDARAQQTMRHGTDPSEYIAYTNTSREDPIEWRYKDSGSIRKLKSLKKIWDPSAVFTRQLI